MLFDLFQRLTVEVPQTQGDLLILRQALQSIGEVNCLFSPEQARAGSLPFRRVIRGGGARFCVHASARRMDVKPDRVRQVPLKNSLKPDLKFRGARPLKMSKALK